MDPEDLIDILAPVLALVGSVGMSFDDRAEWMIAAGSALRHFPEDLIRRGATAAQLKADHPSKIVAIINAEICEDYEIRKAHRRAAAEHNALFNPANALPAPGQVRPTHAEVDAILTEFGIPSYYGRAEQRKHLGPPHNPTTEDYIALGLEPPQAQIAAQDVARARLPAPKQRDDGQIGKRLGHHG